MFLFENLPPLNYSFERRSVVLLLHGLPRWLNGKESACQCRRHKRCRFNPWVGKIPRMRKWPSTPQYSSWKIPWTEEPGGVQSIGSQNSLTQLSNWAHSLASNIINSMGSLAPHLISFGHGLIQFPQHRNCYPTNIKIN